MISSNASGVELPKYFAGARSQLAEPSGDTNWQKNIDLEMQLVN